MAKEKPVSETLETIAEKITALAKTIDERFAQVDQRFAQVDRRFAQVDQRFGETNAQITALAKTVDRRFDETESRLGVKIEAVDAKVTLVFDAVIALRELSDTNTKDHERFNEHLENHDIRILALEPSKPATA